MFNPAHRLVELQQKEAQLEKELQECDKMQQQDRWNALQRRLTAVTEAQTALYPLLNDSRGALGVVPRGLPVEVVAARSLVAAAKRLYNRDLLAACDGNLSVRLPNGNILITPSAREKAFLDASEMAIIGIDGQAIKGKASSETPMHLHIYQRYPEAKAVVHAHPPNAIAWTLAKPQEVELPLRKLPELMIALGRCPITPYAVPGSQQMGEVLEEHLKQGCRAFILQFHGALAWGENLTEAVGGVERIEHATKILVLAEGLGGATEVGPEFLEPLRKIREKIHPRLF